MLAGGLLMASPVAHAQVESGPWTYASPGVSFYDKFGAYRTNSGQGPATVVWSGIRFWRK
ncbi:hypothetical protein ALI22I_17025 [Saccharothrix sp. ALI-22-I]|nr:hypothetical protein ALI22I_17025 [Saccharothrix sp. ALI-22-I]